MTLVWTLLALLLVLILLFLVARLRLIVRYEPNARHIFMGVERIGVRYDLAAHQYQGVAFGWVFFRRTADEEGESNAPTERTRVQSIPAPHQERERTRFSLQHAQILARALPTVIRVMGSYVSKLWRGIRLDECRIHVVFGCPTPDATGSLLGGWYAISGCLPGVARNCVLTPDWEQTRFDGTGYVSLSIRVYRILLPTLWLAGQVIHHRMWRLFSREA